MIPLFDIDRRFDGQPRCLGLELEFVGVSLPVSAAEVAAVFGGQVEQVGKYRYRVPADAGDFIVELDVQLMHKLNAHHNQDHGQKSDDHFFEDTLDSLLSPIVTQVSPSEIVSPPLMPTDLPRFEQLVERLRRQGAKGTGASLINAFGLHVNIDVPSLEASSLLAYLQSFILLQEWLLSALDMDMTRRLTCFAKLYNDDYARLVLDSSYRPEIGQLIEDYLQFNPTRNRALDLLPLFAYIDEHRVRAVVKDALVKKRPTFHFRMPNCRIDEPGWTASAEIGCWAEVERLAGNPSLRREMATAYLANLSRFLHHFDRNWMNETTHWLKKA